MEDINSLRVQMIGKEKEIADGEKLLKIYADGYTFNPAIFHKEWWRWRIKTEIVRVEGWAQ